MSDKDAETDSDNTETRPINDREIKYLVGTGGSTRLRLEQFSGATLQIKNQTLIIKGSTLERDLASLAVKITLQQMEGGVVDIDYEEFESSFEHTIDMIDVPKSNVGYLVGPRGSTMRALEQETKTFMFLKNMKSECLSDTTKRLYIMGSSAARRTAAEKVRSTLSSKPYSSRQGWQTRRRDEPSLLDRRDERRETRRDERREERREYDRSEYDRFEDWRRQEDWRRYTEWRRGR